MLEQLGTHPVDLLIVFIEGSHTGAVEDIASTLRKLISPNTMVGTTASGVLGQHVEVEDEPSLSIWAATGVDASALRIEPGKLEPNGGWPPSAGGQDQHAILFADPFSTPIDRVLEAAAGASPKLSIHGGLSSAGRGPGGNRLLLDGIVFEDGAVGVDLGSTAATSVVSQGCRPVGNPYTVTRASENCITELASQRPLDLLNEVAANASEQDQALLANGVHIGIAFDEGQVEQFDRGDFLIRGVLGADPSTGAISIGTAIDVGATVQFHVRDAATASEDLSGLLVDAGRSDVSGALCFTCNGRGERLFAMRGHDAELIHTLTNSPATAGMFCAGELGPVRSENHIHTFTASALLFG